MQLGIHWSNVATSTEDMRLFRMSNFQLVKLMWLHTAQEALDILQARPGTSLIMRLPDFPQPPMDDLPGRYADECMGHISRLYPLIKRYQVSNEDNQTWRKQPNGPAQWQFYFRLAVLALRHQLVVAGMADVELIGPPLSFDPKLWRHDSHNPTDFILDEWLDAFGWTSQPIWSLFPVWAVNAYWQDPTIPAPNRRLQMYDGSYGGCFGLIHQRSGNKPVILLEAGNSNWHRVPQPTPAECYAAMTAQYPDYVRWLRTFPFVQGVCFYLLGGTEDWKGFRVTEPTIQRLTQT